MTIEVQNSEFLPDSTLPQEEMVALQRAIADAARFHDSFAFDPEAIEMARPLTVPDELFSLIPFHSLTDQSTPSRNGTTGGAVISETSAVESSAEAPSRRASRVPKETGESSSDRRGTAIPTNERQPIVAGIDQAFLDDRVLSAVVTRSADSLIEFSYAITTVEHPYIPGLLAFREGPPILSALSELTVTPDLLVFDGHGRLHYREAGLATHIGVIVDIPAIGIAKQCLCGSPAAELDGTLPNGTRVDVLADAEVEAPTGTVLGQAFQSRQFDSPNRHINPVFVSPGHRVGVTTATTIIERCCTDYKLPEPIRLADGLADRIKQSVITGEPPGETD